MSSLLNKSLSDIAKQPRGGRASPYSRSSSSHPSSDDKWQHDKFEESNSRFQKSRVPTQKLLVEGLHWEVTEAELKTLFEDIGPVQKLFIKYDRSGRSTGTAIVIYQNVEDAKRARSEYDGANAKGQPITISYEEMRGPPRGPKAGTGRGGASSSENKDLRSRMDLLARLGSGSSRPPANAPKGPAAQTNAASSRGSKAGPVRSVSGSEGKSGGGRAGGGGKGGSAGGREKKTPKTATDLDAELDAFMKAPPATASMAESEHAPKPGQDGDIEMK